MASPTVNQNYGGTIAFGTSTTFTAELTDWDYTGAQREAIETTHLGSTDVTTGKIGNRTYMPNDLVDGGEISATIHFNPDTVPPIHAVPETITLNFGPTADAATWAFSGFITSYRWTAPLDDKMTGEFTIKVSGPITITADT